MPTHNVSNDADLTYALSVAVGGDTIICANGSYGGRTITNDYASDVTIIAANQHQAVFGRIQISGGTHIVLDGLRINADGQFNMLYIYGGSSYITVQNCDIGADNANMSSQQGMRVKDSSYITIQDNYVHHVIDCIVLNEVSSNFTVLRNHVDYMGADGFKAVGIDTCLFQGNYGMDHIIYNSSAHNDFIQFENATYSSTNWTIRDNYVLPQPWAGSPQSPGDPSCQGIFAGGLLKNSLIENNLFLVINLHGITVGDNCTVRNNTVINVNSGGWWISEDSGVADAFSSTIEVDANGTVENNVWTSSSNYGVSGTNVILQSQFGSGAGYYTLDQFVALSSTGIGQDPAGLLPAVGSDIGTKGAYALILDLAGEATPAAPSIPGTPTISGAEYVGQVLTANASTPVTGYPAPTRTWQWYNSVSGAIAGATSSTYTLQASDEGDTLYVVQVETNTTDPYTDTAQSANTGTIAAAATAPAISTKSPADNATGVNINSDIVATFDTTIQAGSGNVYLWRAGQVRETWYIPADVGAAGAHTVGIAGAVLTLGTAQDMVVDADYYLIIDDGAIESTGGIAFPGISDPTAWNWSTSAAEPSPVRPAVWNGQLLLMNGLPLLTP